jgi:hypothetical protein
METKKKTNQFRELGAKLEEWRSEQYRSCLALYKEAGLSFVYETYVSFEKGKTLPSPSQLVEIAHRFQKDPRVVLLIWAKVQMPLSSLDELFDTEMYRLEKKSENPNLKQPKGGVITPERSLENTWIMNLSDRNVLLAHPWLWNVCTALGNAFPLETKFSEFVLPEGFVSSSGAPASELVELLKPWIENQFIVKTASGLRLRLPYIQIPRTEEWEELRRKIFSLTVDSIHAAENQVLYRFVYQRALTAEQADEWVKRIKSVEHDYSTEPHIMSPAELKENQTHVLAVAFGKRRLKK